MSIYTTLKSPFGDLHVVVNESVLIAAGFGNLDSLLFRLKREKEIEPKSVRQIAWLSKTWSDYLDGDMESLTTFKWEQNGGPFQQKAWKVMTKIKAGKVLSYAELAKKAGSPNAVRAAGTACSSNLIAPFIPCHRIIGTNGGLGGYGYGVDLKEKLLIHEGALD